MKKEMTIMLNSKPVVKELLTISLTGDQIKLIRDADYFHIDDVGFVDGGYLVMTKIAFEEVE